jgi:hypothetical protein
MSIASIYHNVMNKIIGVPDQEFDHSDAQHYEINSSERWLRKNFSPIYDNIQTAKGEGRYWSGPGDTAINEFFSGSKKDWGAFAASLRDKTCLEIGPGPCGALGIWWWVETKILVDPLILEYKALQLKMFKKTVYADDMRLLAQNAETLDPGLVGTIDGAIICRNALDHCDDPMEILRNLSKYAKTGCYLLLWTDLWHLDGHNEGHRNITKDRAKFEEDLKALGFEIQQTFEDKGRHSINFGCRAIKK